MKKYLSIFCITFLLVLSVEAATLSDAKMAIRTQNFSKAVKILQPIAARGDQVAQYQLAVLYRNGQGVKANPKEAFRWMKKSALQGYNRAQFSLGVFYEEGVGVKKNNQEAILWYSVAAKQGHKNATERLKKIQSGDSAPALIENAEDIEEALVDAVNAGDSDIVKQLLEAGVSANTKNKYQRPVLLEAITLKHDEIISLLIKHGADVNAVDKYKDRPLFVAASLGEARIVRELVNGGAKLGNKDANGNTALMLAAAKGYKITVSVLLTSKSPVQTKNRKGETAVMLASKGQHESTVKLLKKYGARLPVTQKEGLTVNQKLAVLNSSTTGVYKNWTALMIAVWRGQEDVVAALLKKGAKPNQRDHEGHTPLTRAALQGHDTIISQLVASGADVNLAGNAGKTPLMWASEQGRKKSVEVLLVAGADVQAKDKERRSALSYAILNKHEAITRQLLNNKARADNSLINGKNDLMLSVSTMSLLTVKQLVAAGADISKQDASGHDALWYAVGSANDSTRAEIVDYLIRNHANLNNKDSNGRTLLHQAALLKNNETVVFMLAEKGLSVDARADDGNTALTMAASRGNADAVKVLITKGADVNSKNNIGNTPLILSVLAESVESVKLLLDAGADIDIRNNKREQAMKLAEQSKNPSIIALISKRKKEKKLFGIF